MHKYIYINIHVYVDYQDSKRRKRHLFSKSKDIDTKSGVQYVNELLLFLIRFLYCCL